MAEHLTINQLPYGKPVRTWLRERYGGHIGCSFRNHVPDHQIISAREVS